MLIEGRSVGANYRMILVVDAVDTLLVDFISYENCTLVDEDNLVELFQLIDNCCTGPFESWLKIGENLHHELSVGSILPCEVGWNSTAKCILIIIGNVENGIFLLDSKELSKSAQKAAEKEATVEGVLYFIR